MDSDNIVEKLKELRKPFPDSMIGKLPKPTRRQTDEVKADFKKGFRCPKCGGWHHPKVIHLDYVGHAALTDRLLDVDPMWQWEPLAFTSDGLPLIVDGLLWIRLSILGLSRLGVGDADGKTGGNGVKECIGDALRNAGMRFGLALDLWHKGDMHAIDEHKADERTEILQQNKQPIITDVMKDGYIELMDKSVSMPELQGVFGKVYKESDPKTRDAMTIVYNNNKVRLEGEEKNMGEGNE